MSKTSLLLILGASLLSGCSTFNPGGNSDFACPGMPKGVVCKSPRQVYDSTNTDKAKSGKGAGAPTYVFATEPRSGDSLTPTPVLEQAVVMRIWIAPWVDSNKDLHWPGVMFTEVRPRQWNFGEEQFGGVEPPVPHRSFERAVVKKTTTKSASVGAELPSGNDELN